MSVNVTSWNEYRMGHEVEESEAVYPNGIHNVIAESVKDTGYNVGTATLEPRARPH